MPSFLSAVKTEIERTSEAILNLKKALGSATELRKQLQRTLDLMEGQDEIDGLPSDTAILAVSIQGMNLLDAMVEIAKENSGILVTSQANSVLVAAGVVAPGRPGRNRMWSTLNRRRDKFAHLDTGKYQLVDSAD